MTPMDDFALWQRTLADQPDSSLNPQREMLRQAFLAFREKSAQLVSEISASLPNLTIHDIIHLDALWRVADQIAGPDYPINPAEAFVLGGAFLLHDAAHVLAAYDDGLIGIKKSIEWRDLIAQSFDKKEPISKSQEENSALFQVLRHLHAKQAHKLGKQPWKIPGTDQNIYLLDHLELREYYGDLIGEIAASHHWPAHQVAETFADRHVNAPAFLAPATWEVDVLKIAFLLRTADAAHIDAQRAPWFLFALKNPTGISKEHWRFQAKMGQATRTSDNELRLTSGSAFDKKERQAWWLAYDVACMIDRELRDAQILMRDANRKPFATASVEHASSPETFAKNVRTAGWEPVNVAPKISNIPKLIANLGGAKLYGDKPELALRELIQNSADAVRALRKLDGLGAKEGEIEIVLERDGDLTWLHVTDTGIGMSRYVLSEVLLDFGNSLWSSESLRSELPGLAATGFEAIGCFGIGFFSIFMLGDKVTINTHRFKTSNNENSDQWILEFDDGLNGRPTLRRPDSIESLLRPGTRVSVALDNRTLGKLQKAKFSTTAYSFEKLLITNKPSAVISEAIVSSEDFRKVIRCLCPTLDVNVKIKINQDAPISAVVPENWKTISTENLLEDLYTSSRFSDLKVPKMLIDLKEPTGVLLGRIAYAGSYHQAVITHGGLRNGSVPKLLGIVLGHNNLDLIRNEARSLASKDAWKQWARTWIDSSADHGVDTLIDLHPLCLERDLPVYQIGLKTLNEHQLSSWLECQDEVRVFDEPLTHEDLDYVSADAFSSHFRADCSIIMLPQTDEKLAQALGFPTINYSNRLKKILQEIWGEFKIFEEDDTIIGKVDGENIIRSVVLYTKTITK